MKYDEFLKVATVLKPDEADDYTKMRPWGGCERVQINGLELGGVVPRVCKVKVTAQNVILQEIHLEYFRVDEAGEVYLLTDEYMSYDPILRAERTKFKRAEIEQELVDHQREFADSVAAEKLAQKTGEPPFPDVDPTTATGKDLQMIMEHNQWLRENDRGDEETIPF